MSITKDTTPTIELRNSKNAYKHTPTTLKTQPQNKKEFSRTPNKENKQER